MDEKKKPEEVNAELEERKVTDAEQDAPADDGNNPDTGNPGNESDSAQPETPSAPVTTPDTTTPVADASAPETGATAPDMETIIGQLRVELLQSRAELAAAQLGIPAARAKYAVRMADLGAVDMASPECAKQITTALQQVLKEVPELAAKPQQTTGTPGMFVRQITTAPIDPFERGLRGGISNGGK